ncbi:hypothetical protein ABE073_03905 [Lederbergia citrisecunda]|uniref:hypothetical protein n=1 Tax=Lederbergia citrisecunda TaxID=2833583 RepID=UPI003D2832E3
MVTINREAKNEIKNSIIESMEEVQAIRSGKLPKRSYKEMISRIKESLKEEQQ